MAGFHEIQFPTDISYGSSGGPEFSTEVVEFGGGREQRNANWLYSRERWNVAYGVRAQAQLATLIAFFYARRGRAYGFRFKNHDDYQAVGHEIGTGDDSTVDFQLLKIYEAGANQYARKISKPVTGTVVIYIDSAETSAFTVDTTTGIVTMDSAPTGGEVITADYDFDVPVRFDTDHLPQTFDTYQARSADVPIVELML